MEFFSSVGLDEIRLVRFIESRLHCGLMQRTFGSDEMIWSRGMFTLLDLDPEKEKPSFSLLQSMKHPEDRLTFAQAESRFEAATTISRRFRVIRRDGTLRTLSQHAEILFDGNGKPDKLISVVVDVTESEMLKNQARQMESRLRSFVRHSGLRLSLLGPDGYVKRTLAADAVVEEDQNRRLGFLWHSLIHPEDRVESLAIFEAALKARLPVSREHRVLQSDGSTYRWRRAVWIPVFDNQHNLVEYIAMTQDIENEKNIPVYKHGDSNATGAQVRAGRALVRWSVQSLSDASCVSPAVIRRIEEYDGVTAGSADSLSSICSALQKAGVEFLFPRTGKPAVRLT